ncbi:putative thiamine transport system ATP-binding protein [Blastomonas natatoria]|jgi:putative thiamine transport system ATP-binding protein|uniref:Putative thiamine transport system ATP-binding protein n=1 Tax=Blastomonas natatoria TaxID=34015 RepID=A0A2V3V8U4_9SPHN|nr:ATP-binding cassette domain-containing protein [Blastomonas natatoria]PXW78193.1 putative thiamine transport system ATP-binding protein [Blastomonas natatoria]|tara:strand:+ start:337 stop:963 length:627 start_codon:yes stop_codon:yes gene_type:complete
MTSAGLILNDVRLAIGGRTLFDGLCLCIAPGEIVTLMGESGSGKSSLIAYICGSLDTEFDVRGSVTLDGQDMGPLPIERRRIGVMFQDDVLFAHMSVGENLAFAVPPGVTRSERQTRVNDALVEADLDGFAARNPATLSGGQKARVALMRALLAEPRAMLLDEPFSRLDATLRERVRNFAFSTIKRRNIPALLVTHDRQDKSDHVITL